MDSSDEESGPNSGGSNAEEELDEDEEMGEASEQDESSAKKNSENAKSRNKSREQELKVSVTKKMVEAKKEMSGEDSSAEEEETGDEEMSSGSEQDGSSEEKETGNVKSTTRSAEHESKKSTTTKQAKKRGGSTAEEGVADGDLTRETGQDGRSDVNGQEAKKQTSAKKANAKKNKGKTGVVYLSRIPPHMKPLKLRHLLSQYGEVSRIYLAPEDSAARIRRKRAGGNRGKNFSEGWVEFVHKRDAKRIAAMLNGEPVDPRKRSAYHYDLWTIKYLKRFKWDNLTAEIVYKKAVRDQKVAAEISAAKKERDFYLAKVDQARAITSMEERKQKRKKPEVNGSAAAGDGGSRDDGTAKKSRFVRSFHQRKSVVDPAMETKSSLAADVLAGVFGNSTVK